MAKDVDTKKNQHLYIWLNSGLNSVNYALQSDPNVLWPDSTSSESVPFPGIRANWFCSCVPLNSSLHLLQSSSKSNGKLYFIEYLPRISNYTRLMPLVPIPTSPLPLHHLKTTQTAPSGQPPIPTTAAPIPWSVPSLPFGDTARDGPLSRRFRSPRLRAVQVGGPRRGDLFSARGVQEEHRHVRTSSFRHRLRHVRLRGRRIGGPARLGRPVVWVWRKVRNGGRKRRCDCREPLV